MDAASSSEIVQKVRQLASSVPLVRNVEKSYVRKMGFDYYVDIHIEVDGHLSVTHGPFVAERRLADSIGKRVLGKNLLLEYRNTHEELHQLKFD